MPVINKEAQAAWQAYHDGKRKAEQKYQRERRKAERVRDGAIANIEGRFQNTLLPHKDALDATLNDLWQTLQATLDQHKD